MTSWIVLGVLVVSTSLAGVQATAPLDRALAGLHSPDYTARAKSLDTLKGMFDADPTLLNKPVVQQAVIELLERENATIIANYRSGAGSSEDYGEWYAGPVAETVLEVLPHLPPKTRPRMITAMVNGSYNPESRWAQDLALHGEEVVPDVLALAKSDDVPSRWNAYALMVELLKGHQAGTLQPPLAAASVPAVQRALRDGLRDRDVTCRRRVVDALVAVGDRDAIPLLSKLAQSDPDQEPGNRAVRGRAAEAIWILQHPR